MHDHHEQPFVYGIVLWAVFAISVAKWLKIYLEQSNKLLQLIILKSSIHEMLQIKLQKLLIWNSSVIMLKRLLWGVFIIRTALKIDQWITTVNIKMRKYPI